MTGEHEKKLRGILQGTTRELNYVDGMGGYGMGTLETLSHKVNVMQKGFNALCWSALHRPTSNKY